MPSEHPTPCPPGEHRWGPNVTLREPDFGVAFASYRTCAACGWRLYENWCETRASGGAPRLLPPLPAAEPLGDAVATIDAEVE